MNKMLWAHDAQLSLLYDTHWIHIKIESKCSLRYSLVSSRKSLHCIVDIYRSIPRVHFFIEHGYVGVMFIVCNIHTGSTKLVIKKYKQIKNGLCTSHWNDDPRKVARNVTFVQCYILNLLQSLLFNPRCYATLKNVIAATEFSRRIFSKKKKEANYRNCEHCKTKKAEPKQLKLERFSQLGLRPTL